MKIGIVVAMEKEFNPIVNSLENSDFRVDGHFTFAWGNFGNHNVIAVRAGIGKVHAALGTTMLIYHARPDCILSIGCSGAIDKALNVGDIVCADEVVYHDVWCGEGNDFGQVQGCPSRFSSSPKLCEKFTDCGEVKMNGLFVSGEFFIPTPEVLQRLNDRFCGAIATDMESAAVAQTCWIEDYPFAALRVISDTPCKPELSPAAQYQQFWNDKPDESFIRIMNIVKSI